MRQSVIRTTLVIFPGALGDFICFLPALCSLRERYLAGNLGVVAHSSLLPLAVRPGLADVGGALEAAAISTLFVENGTIAAPVPGVSVGDVYSWFGSRDPILRKNLRRLAAGRVRCAPFGLSAGYGGHATRHFLEGAGLPAAVPSRGSLLPLRHREEERAREFFLSRGLNERRVLAMHCGAGSARKRWPADGYAAVAEWWHTRGGAVLQIVGPCDVAIPAPVSHVVASGFALNEVAALLARANVYLGGDTGVSHLAGSVGLAGVVIFGPTRARTWRPLGGRLVSVVSLPSDGGRLDDDTLSLHAVSVERVIRALRLVS